MRRMGFNLDDYETVEERLIKFWKEHPDGRIVTSMLSGSGSQFIVRAELYKNGSDPVWATGLAEETVQGRGVNSKVRLRIVKHLLSVALWLTLDMRQRAREQVGKK